MPPVLTGPVTTRNVATAPADPEIDPSPPAAPPLRADCTGTEIDDGVKPGEVKPGDAKAVFFGVNLVVKFTCRIALLPCVCPDAFWTKTRLLWIFAND